MDQGTGLDKAINMVSVALLAISAFIAVAAESLTTTGSRNANGFWVAAFACLAAGVLLSFLHTIVWPALLWLNKVRASWIASIQTPNPTPTRASAVPNSPFERTTASAQAAVPASGLHITGAIYGVMSKGKAVDRTDAVRLPRRRREGRLRNVQQ